MSGLKLIVGLGNPGPEYAQTRHNAGAWFVESLAESAAVRLGRDAKLHAELGKAGINGHNVWLARPTTFMNHSGRAVIALLNYYRIEPEQMLVAHDELDLPAGTVRLKFDGGHGGQNGLRDIIGQLGHGRFHRLRVGIGHPGHKDRVTGWVLGRPGQDDERAIRDGVDAARNEIGLAVAGDFEAAMRRLHTPRT
ncbi:aminoacyl-tRNA hydrolase [Pseudofulvimonas gallinarii]|jgi:PTH1 family peptidyl-tRNA hydrolase|uniref:Peptidyl-tRNA hydrolase n=1 Tax=Pseudofulvimonas gallinarii TaxID=634155 RepID=A0A4S3KUI8_9GAMM|nr:aminoacyl-tRNA hydrolase [Pseudofulvimonas gallinarii]TCT00738.1 peptidyl-tRNA hydrolase [Pseudofulvimonas gallinarii]THD12776.1 aminoacyl-tRNA hydrolase [Pseudofulvimonas gallinarii]